MISALVLSTPRSGTRFYLYFLREVLGIDARYAHFGFTEDARILELADLAKTVIVVQRPIEQLRESWDGSRQDEMKASIGSAKKLEPMLSKRGALLMDIEKGEHTWWQFTQLLVALDLDWNAGAVTFFDEWPVIGSRHSESNARDKAALATSLLSRIR